MAYLIIAAVIMASLLAAFWANVRQRQAEAARLQQIHKIGKAWERPGGLIEAEYVRTRSLTDSILKTGAVTDPDLDWLLGLLKERPNSIVHANILAILSELKTVPTAQRERIVAALPPMLQSKNELEYRPAQRVQSLLAKSRPPR